MSPASVPMIDRLMPDTTLSRSEPPTVTISAPEKTMPPTIRVFSREAKRLRKAIWIRTRRVESTSVRSCGLGLSCLATGLGHLAIGQPYDGGGVGHHLGVMGREDEGGLLGAVELLH